MTAKKKLNEKWVVSAIYLYTCSWTVIWHTHSGRCFRRCGVYAHEEQWKKPGRRGKKKKLIPILRDFHKTHFYSRNTIMQFPPSPQNHLKNACWQHNKDTNKRKRRPMNSSRHLHSSRRLKTRRVHYNVLLKLNTPYVFHSSHQDTWNEPKKTQLDVVKKQLS